jgi:tetratricopeptide (TPR) repeat protein
MNKGQIFSILAATILFAVLYFGFSTKPENQKVLDKSRSIQTEALDIRKLAQDALEHLAEAEVSVLKQAESAVESATSDAQRAVELKKLSALWYGTKNFSLAADAAERVASLENADSSWSVAGASFFEALSSASDESVREYCAKHAISAFESAISLKPEVVEHRVNLALVYAEHPPKDNPMKAVLMLRELEGQYPESPAVYNALGRLAIKTGQWDRAVTRLEKAWELDKKNPNTPCLLSKAYEGVGNKDKAREFAQKCGK